MCVACTQPLALKSLTNRVCGFLSVSYLFHNAKTCLFYKSVHLHQRCTVHKRQQKKRSPSHFTPLIRQGNLCVNTSWAQCSSELDIVLDILENNSYSIVLNSKDLDFCQHSLLRRFCSRKVRAKSKDHGKI